MNRIAVANELVEIAKILAFDAQDLSAAKAVLKAIGKLPGAQLETYKNGRENGFALTKGEHKVVFSEYRNSDSIVVYGGGWIGDFTANNIPSDSAYAMKKFFEPKDYDGAARFIRQFLG